MRLIIILKQIFNIKLTIKEMKSEIARRGIDGKPNWPKLILTEFRFRLKNLKIKYYAIIARVKGDNKGTGN